MNYGILILILVLATITFYTEYRKYIKHQMEEEKKLMELKRKYRRENDDETY